MCRLIDDICIFLEANGFECSPQMRFGLDVICTKTLEGKHSRLILPMEINARTLEEATAASEYVHEAIWMLKGYEGYPLIITEDRWKRQRAMMEARLLAHLELFSQAYARNCEVRRIEKAEAREFLNRNHSYGYAACKYRYGLFLKRHTGHIADEMGFPIGSGMTDEVKNLSEGLLIAVATFSNARKWIKDGKEIRSYEWTRYASLPDLRVSGGMGKMLKTFIKEVQPDDIMSYADLEWSEGKVYERLGFEAEAIKEPVTFTIDTLTWERKAIRRSPVKPGMTGEKPGMTEEKPGMTGERPGMTDEKPGMTGERPGMTGEKPGMTEGKSRTTGEKPGMTEGMLRTTEGMLRTTEGDNVIPDLIGDLFFRNFGSRKFRLKLTDYK